MIKLEKEMNWRDIRQWLRDGWFWYKNPESEEYAPAVVVSWPPSTETGEDSPHDRAVIALSENDTHPVGRNQIINNVFPHWPNLGSLNFGAYKVAIHVTRMQSKQWCRTYNIRQLRLIIPRQKQLKIRGVGGMNTFECVPEVFTPQYPSADGAKQLFNEGWKSVALTSNVIVTNTTPRFVYFRGELAAAIKNQQLISINERLVRRVEKVLGDGGIEL